MQSTDEMIECLKTLPENSGQKIRLKHQPDKVFYFMWFFNDDVIDLEPIDNINIFSVHKRHWDKLELVF